MFIYILTLIVSLTATSQVEQYRLNVKTNECLPLESELRPRQAISVKDFRYVDQSFFMDDSFLEKMPICSKAKTCLTADRINRLIWEGSLPKGANSINFLTTDFKDKAAQSCTSSEVKSNIPSFKKLTQYISGQKSTYPPETKMAYELVSEVKATTKDFLRKNKKAFQILHNCLKIDADFEKEGILTENRQLRYETRLKNKENLQKGCSRIWDPTKEIAEVKRQLTKMRQALFGIALLENDIVKNENDFLSLAAELEKNPDHLKTKIAPQHLKGPIPSRIKNLFWDDTAKNLEPINNYERSQFNKYLGEIIKKHPYDIKIKDRLMLDYYENISNNPLIAYFDSARPNAQDMLKAFDKKRLQQEKALDSSPDDIEYLQFHVLLTKVLESKPPELVGDYCVLAQQLIRIHRDHQAALSSFVTSTLLAEGGVAAEFAKGFGKKILALFLGAQYSGIPAMSYFLEKSTEEFNKNMKLCADTFQGSSELCSPLAIEEAKTAQNLSIALAMLIGGKSILMPQKTKPPATLSGGE